VEVKSARRSLVLCFFIACAGTFAIAQIDSGANASLLSRDAVHFSISVSSGAGGKIVRVSSERPNIGITQRAGSPDPAASEVDTADAGQSAYFAVVPSEGWEIESMRVDGQPYVEKRNPELMISQYRWPIVAVKSISANHSVRATFKQQGCVITASASAHGSILPAGSVSLSRGALQEFTMTPDSGYNVSSVIIDGKSVTPVTKYTFTNVAYDHSIAVTFGN
jgi:hypothetical protein